MPCPQPEDPPPDTAAASKAHQPQVQCYRCRTATATAHFRDASYCLPCARANFDQKTKAGLEAARGAGIARFISRAATTPASGHNDRQAVNASLALGFSAGLSSSVLLRTATQYFRPDNQRGRTEKERENATENDDGTGSVTSKMSALNAGLGRTSEVAKVYVIFIDDSAIIPDGRDRTADARALFEAEACDDFEFVGLKLEDVYLADGESEGGCAVACSAESGPDRLLSPSTVRVDDRRAALRSLFASLHPEDTPRTGIASARTRTEDLHRILVNYLLRREATRRGCSALMLGESGTRLSIRLIESLAKGGGHKLPIEGSDAVWIDDLLVARPLKTHLIQEVKFFAEANNVRWLPDQDLVPSAVPAGSAYNASGEPLMDKSSIGRLTETFILNLERGVPSTVSTIGKTGSKLVLKPEEGSEPLATATAPALTPAPAATAAPATTTTTTTAPPISVPAFEQVGPSAPLGRKARKAKAKEAASNGSSMVLEPRVGARGSRLAHAARSLPRWAASETRRACPLCYMPAGQGAKDWKNEITISTLDGISDEVKKEPAARAQETDDRVDLASLLCYACILMLETPERPLLVHATDRGGGQRDADASMLLPPYVLSNVRHRLSDADAVDAASKGAGDAGGWDGQVAETDADIEASLDAAADGGRRQMAAGAASQQGQVPRKVGRNEMRQRIDEFLLPTEGDDDDDEQHQQDVEQGRC
ncbi:uncharacterized protein PFL1_01654 [Pseudozyma flocculosa PF-1]|uniref:Cytoplasmic tRNA 2-thiolation protein 2 n=1 Tax=Pseudozyma flocculosa TaxID=84751 RepID=A0A5C3F0T7_9BASI|nr:uncharacterized protein PFL1_01654 [Pseudozyma flocculosa PF-1]EPQ30753.1 hypothetical protein PFL1_01654 [Pseudozyma flocculosa PF-1]SPO36891.1 uncharacterized protein PSFLO_02362 [Pseudozyma flocculosa]